jgi:hypothetical protein
MNRPGQRHDNNFSADAYLAQCGRRRGAVRQEFQKVGRLASVPPTFETLQVIPPGGCEN